MKRFRKKYVEFSPLVNTYAYNYVIYERQCNQEEVRFYNPLLK